MIDGMPNAVEREIEGTLYHFNKMSNAQAAEMLDKWGALLRPIAARFNGGAGKEDSVVVLFADRIVNALTNVSFKQMYKLAQECAVFIFDERGGKVNFEAMEWAGRWGEIIKLVSEFISVNYSGFSALLPKGSGLVMQLLKKKMSEALQDQGPAATPSIGSLGDPSKKDGQPTKKSDTDGLSTN